MRYRLPTFRLDIEPSTSTAQERRWRAAYINGHWQAVSYLPKKLQTIKKQYMDQLANYAPATPLDGPIYLRVVWLFPWPKSRKHKEPEDYKDTKPDTDNLMKLFKDCMTASGFWVDDSRVCVETAIKRWSDRPGIEVEYESLLIDDETAVPF